jgi:integrase
VASVTIEWRNERPYLSWVEAGRRWRRSLGKLDATAAEKIRSAKQAELEHGVRILPRLPTVKQFLEPYLDWYAVGHPTTERHARGEVKRFIARFGHRAIDSIRPDEAEDYVICRIRDDEAAPETVGKEVRRLKTAFKRGIAWRQIDVDPMETVKAPKGVRDVAVEFYTHADLAKLYETNPLRADLWRFTVNTGLRRGELAKATKADVIAYANGMRLRVESKTATERTKSGKRREIPLNESAAMALESLPERIAGAERDTLTHWFADDARAAGIGGNLHRLRHTFCAHLAMAGVSLRRIQLLAGHADYKTTEMYAHLCPNDAASEVGLIHL